MKPGGSSTVVYAIKGGFLYYFQFSGKQGDELYQDFVRMMESVVYDSDKK